MSVVTVVLVTFLSLHVFAGELDANRRKVETLAKADRLLGQRHNPPAGKPLSSLKLWSHPVHSQ